MSGYNRCKECYNMKCIFATGEREDIDTDIDTSKCSDFRPMTNYDRLVSKTPEELAKTIVGWLADVAELCGENRQEFDFPKAEEYAVSWLKAPVEEVDNGT